MMGESEPFAGNAKKEKDKKLLECLQNVTFGSEPAESNQLCCTDIKVICSPGNHTSGSSNVKLRNVVDFNWDLKNYPGQLIAVHFKGNFFAYGLKAMSKGDSGGTVAGMVRVVSHATSQRGLIRGLRGMVQDLAFSHLQQEVVLACVDQQGILLVHRIEEKGGAILTSLLLHVAREETNIPATVDVHRVVWCPFIPEEGANTNMDSEVGQLLVLTRGPHAEMWCVPLVNARHGSGPLFPRQVSQGLLQVPTLDSTITDAAFSPDGTALAIASAGGLVSFFQVYMHNHSLPRCLHSWRPHGDKPLSTLYFLDNHRDYNPDIQFWKWAITGAKDNSEIKLWTCESWTCLQTINFEPHPNSMSPSSGPTRCILKAALDLSSHYLVLSDIYNRMLYVLQLQLEDGPAHVSIISGFTLPQPAMSFCIFEAGLRARSNERPDGEEEDGEEEFEDEAVMSETRGDSILSSVLLKMFVVQPKSLQEVRLAFKPNAKPPTLSHDTIEFAEDSSASISTNGESCSSSDVPSITTAAAAADLPANHTGPVTKQTPVSEALNTSVGALNSSNNSLNISTNLNSSANPLNNSNSNSLNTSGGLNLMTPEAFSSPARHEDSPSRASNVSSSGCSVKRSTHTPPPPTDLPQPSELTPVNQMKVEVEEGELISLTSRDNAMASGGSSPSREVQQILALQDNNVDELGDDFFEDKLDQEDIGDTEDKEPEIGKAEEDDDEEEVTNWPQIPLIPMAENPLQSAQSASEQLASLPVPPAPVLIRNDELLIELRSMQNCLQTLTMVVENQQSDIKNLRSELKTLMPQTKAIEAAACTAIEQSLSYQLQRQNQAIDTVMREKLAEMRESLTSTFAKNMDSIISTRLSHCLNTEVNKQLVPAVLTSMQPLKEIIHNEVTNKLSATDHLLKERLTQLTTNQHFQNTLATSVTNSLQMQMPAIFRDSLMATVVPSFDKTLRVMFNQLNETFSRGTREHMAALDAHMEKVRQRNTDRAKDTTAQINALSESVRLGNDATANMVRTELNTAMASAVVGLQESVSRASREAVNESVAKALREQSQSLQVSRPATPQARIDPQAHLTSLINMVAKGQLNTAFQQALSASDLNLVVKLCERVNPQQIFSQTPCPLEQPVLLSLIQQLAADLNTQTELKQRYLSEAVMNINPDDTVSREYMPAVLKSLHNQLTLFIQANPNKQITRSLRMLLMATESLIKK